MAFRCIRVGEKSTALADNTIDRKVILKHALPGDFSCSECDEVGEIAREILQKMEVIGDILLCAERVLREQNGKLCLNPERRTERFRKKAGAARHFLAVQLVEQKIERDLIFRGEAVAMKGCERCFHTLQQGIIRGAVRDGNRAERGGAGAIPREAGSARV